MRVSAAGRALIMQREGRELTAYVDSVGVLTIGVGHTGRMSEPPVTAGMRITPAEADAFLASDLAPVEAAINTAVKVPLSQNEFDAMASLAFNIGTSGFEKSSVVRLLNSGQVAAAAEAFLMWDKPAALLRRREAERLQFLTADKPAAVSPVVAPELVPTVPEVPKAPKAPTPSLLSRVAAFVLSFFRGA